MHKILVVDDSNIMRNLIERIGGAAELDVVGKASNGLEAIEAYKKHRPDLVTMDLTMPQMDGIECIKSLVAIDPNVLVLVVSALSDKFTLLQAIDVGARGFLNKPINEQMLSEAIGKVLATRG